MENLGHSFENKRWEQSFQKVEFRHKAGLELLPKDIETLLDVGCGEGTYISLINNKYPEIKITGSDMSEVALERLNKRKLNIKSALADANGKLPFKDETYDVVAALDVLEHTLEPEVMLNELVRVSKKYLIFSVPNFSSFPARVQMLLGHVPENNKPNKGHMYWFNRGVLHNLLEDKQLQVVEEMSNHQLQNKKIVGYFTKILHIIAPSLFSLSFVVLVEKKK